MDNIDMNNIVSTDESMDIEMKATEQVESDSTVVEDMDGLIEDTDDDSASEHDSADIEADSPIADAKAPQTRRKRTSPLNNALTLGTGGRKDKQKDKVDLIFHELKNSQVSGSPLTGIFSGMETLENGSLIVVIVYKGQRVVIPLQEMMISISRPEGQSDAEYANRTARIMNTMLGAEIDFVVRSVDTKGRAAVASRKAAMLRLRRRYYLDDNPMVYADRAVEARIVAVSQMAIRIEVFGVETTIHNRNLGWGFIGDARDEFSVGDTVMVMITDVSGDNENNLAIKADIRSLTSDTSRNALDELKIQSNYVGTVSDVRKGVVFLRLLNGASGIAHKCLDAKGRKPGRGDTVNFVVIRKDEESGAAVGLIARIISRNP